MATIEAKLAIAVKALRKIEMPDTAPHRADLSDWLNAWRNTTKIIARRLLKRLTVKPMNDEILNDLRKNTRSTFTRDSKLEPPESEPQGNHIFSEKAEIDMATTEYMINKHGLLAMCRRIADAKQTRIPCVL